MLNKKYLFFLFLSLVLLTVEIFFHQSIAHKLKIQVVQAIEKQNLAVSFNDLDYGYFPPHIKLQNLSYKDEKNILNAQAVSISIKLLPLIKGKIVLNNISIDKSNSSFNISTAQSMEDPLFPKLTLESLLEETPFEQISISNSKAILFIEDKIVNLDIKQGSFQKLYKKIQVEVESLITIRSDQVNDTFNLNTKIRWQEGSFFLSFFTLQKSNSIVQLSGSIKEQILKDFRLSTNKIYSDINELRLQINIDLAEFEHTIKYFVKKYLEKLNKENSKFEGRLQASGYYFNSKESKNKSLINIQAENLKTPFFKLYALKLKGELRSNDFFSEKIKIDFNDKSSLDLNNVKLIHKNSNLLLSTDLKTSYLRLEDLLASLNLKAGGLRAPISMNAHCGGVALTKTFIKCSGNTSLLSLNILNSQSPNKILSVNKLSTSFDGMISKSDFSFNGEAKYKNPKSKTHSSALYSGKIDYITGFNIDFETTPFDLNLINEIAGQSVQGITAITGKAMGSSKWGEVQIQMDNQDFKFNKLNLGNNQADLQYKFPKLDISRINGKLNIESQGLYTGLISLDVDSNDLLIDLTGSKIDDNAVRKLFKDTFDLPLQLKFETNFLLKARNGIDINKMDLDFTGSIQRPSFYGESFVDGALSIQGLGGDWRLTSALRKETSNVNTSGRLNGFKTIDLKVFSENFKIEQSDFLKETGLRLTGPLDFNLIAQGPIDGPKATGTIRLENSRGHDKNSLGDSLIEYRLFENEFTFKGLAFDKKLSGEGSYPLSKTGKLSFTGLINGLNLLNFINLNSSNIPDTELLLWSEADFTVPNISKDSPTGTLKNTRFQLISENQTLALVQQSKNTSFQNPVEFIIEQQKKLSQITLDFSKAGQSRIFIQGLIHLDFLKPFVPTCEFIGGTLTPSDDFSVIISPLNLETKGFAKIENGSFKTDSFPYPFSKISSHINLNKNTIQFKDIKAYTANTLISGNGFIKSLSDKNFVNFDISYQGLKIEFPPKVTTKTNGKLKLSGSSIPLTLSGSLSVQEGLFTQDLINSTSSMSVSPNKRLPVKILQSSSPPALLDVNVYIKDKMKVANNEANGNVYGFVKAIGNPIDPLINGEIKLSKGLIINFHDKEFLLNEGSVTYKNKLINDPQIFIDALAKIIDSNDPLETIYEIRMLIKGNASNPQIKFSSQPFLEENQIISLLTIGTVSTQSIGQEITTTEQATYSGLQFGSYLMQKNQALKDLQKQTGTQIGISSSLNAGGVNPKVFVKKSWTPKSSTTVSQTFGNQRNLSFTTEYKLNRKVSTILGVQNNQTEDASQLVNRRVQQGVIFDLGLQYKFEFN